MKYGFRVIFFRKHIGKIPTQIRHKPNTNKRQKKAIEHISKHGKITTKEYVHLVNTSTITAKRDLLDLKSKNIIKFKGSAKTGYYVLNDTVNDTVNED